MVGKTFRFNGSADKYSKNFQKSKELKRLRKLAVKAAADKRVRSTSEY